MRRRGGLGWTCGFVRIMSCVFPMSDKGRICGGAGDVGSLGRKEAEWVRLGGFEIWVWVSDYWFRVEIW